MRGGRSGPGARPRRRRKSSGMTWAGRGGRAREGLRVSPASRGPREATPTRSPAARPAPGLARGDQGRPVPRGAEALAESLLLWPDHWALPAGLVPEKGRSGPREGEIRPPAQCCPPRRPLPPLRAGDGRRELAWAAGEERLAYSSSPVRSHVDAWNRWEEPSSSGVLWGCLPDLSKALGSWGHLCSAWVVGQGVVDPPRTQPAPSWTTW
nr:uncharacterized protein LOC105102172 isoform X3 [Camelus dromedarius]